MVKKYCNFLIVGAQRTGSSALAAAIDHHDEIVCGWEWTQRVAPWKKIKLARLGLDGIFTGLKKHHRCHMDQVITEQCRWLGFRRLFRSSDAWLFHPRFAPALLFDRFESHLNWLSQNPDIRIIHIVRYDNIDWLKSKYMSQATGSYIGRKYPEKLQVVIPIAKALARLQSKEWVDGRLAGLKLTNPYLRIHYEDLLAQPEKVNATVLDFFEVEIQSQQDKTMTARQSQGVASDYIENYTALKAALEERSLLTSTF